MESQLYLCFHYLPLYIESYCNSGFPAGEVLMVGASERMPVLLTNRLIMLGRFAFVLLIGLIAVSVGLVLLFLDPARNRWIALVLFLFPLPLLWFPFRVPISVLLGDDLGVRYLFWRKTYSFVDVCGVNIEEIYVSSGPNLIWNLLHDWYVSATIVLKDGKHIILFVDRNRLSELQSQLQVRGLTWNA